MSAAAVIAGSRFSGTDTATGANATIEAAVGLSRGSASGAGQLHKDIFQIGLTGGDVFDGKPLFLQDREHLSGA